MRFYICPICGNLFVTIEDSGNLPTCCGKVMKELRPASTDGAIEKHVPVCREIKDKDCKSCTKEIHVMVGSEPHPMEEAHYIQWIILETDKGVYRKKLCSKDKPEAVFYIKDCEKIVATYEYCNLHGLWKNEKFDCGGGICD